MSLNYIVAVSLVILACNPYLYGILYRISPPKSVVAGSGKELVVDGRHGYHVIRVADVIPRYGGTTNTNAIYSVHEPCLDSTFTVADPEKSVFAPLPPTVLADPAAVVIIPSHYRHTMPA